MKKLMMAVAVVCAAVCANAATSYWTWGASTSVLKDGYTGKGSSSSALSGTTIYLLASDATGAGSKQAEIDLLKDLRDGTMTQSDVAKAALVSAKTGSNGQIASGNAFTREDIASGVTKYYYEVAFSDDGKYVYMSAQAGGAASLDSAKPKAIATSSAASTNLKDATGEASYSAPGWYAINVPEPTSGLLLLLGMAGLALKRKRA